jgi:glutamine amidotransferase
MGWNNLSVSCPHPILEGIDPEAQFYFVHSYYPEPAKLENIIATTDYGVRFASVIGSANVVATQFHPEKSGREGLRILENFSKWNGKPDHRDTCASTA